MLLNSASAHFIIRSLQQTRLLFISIFSYVDCQMLQNASISGGFNACFSLKNRKKCFMKQKANLTYISGEEGTVITSIFCPVLLPLFFGSSTGLLERLASGHVSLVLYLDFKCFTTIQLCSASKLAFGQIRAKEIKSSCLFLMSANYAEMAVCRETEETLSEMGYNSSNHIFLFVFFTGIPSDWRAWSNANSQRELEKPGLHAPHVGDGDLGRPRGWRSIWRPESGSDASFCNDGWRHVTLQQSAHRHPNR